MDANLTMQNNLNEEEPATYFQRVYKLNRLDASKNEHTYMKLIECGGKLNMDEYMKLVGRPEPSNVPQANEELPNVSGSALSKDYEKLYDRIRNSEHVAVWVDCDWHDGTVTRDIAAVKRFDYADINIGARGIEYGSVRKWKLENKTEKQAFIDECERLKLEFV